jgi:hypothetical protein
MNLNSGIAIFIRFLSENAAINQFISNFNRLNDITLPNYINSKYRSEEDFRSLISSAFSWDNTPEGFTYWCKLSHQWRRHVTTKNVSIEKLEKEEKNRI